MTAAWSRAILAASVLAFGCAADGGTDDEMGDGMADSGADDMADGADDMADGSDDGTTETGQVAFRFEVTSSVRESSNLEDELTGSIYGALFHSADVGITGPREGSESFASIEAFDIDLTAMDAVSDVAWTSEGLAPAEYTFLGYFDVDSSSDGATERDPEAGDPVTLPTVNKFTVEVGTTTEITVRFDLVYTQ